MVPKNRYNIMKALYGSGLVMRLKNRYDIILGKPGKTSLKIPLSHLHIFCSKCGLIGIGNPELHKGAYHQELSDERFERSKIHYKKNPILFGTMVESDGYFRCPDCLRGRVLFHDYRLHPSWTRNPWGPQALWECTDSVHDKCAKYLEEIESTHVFEEQI